jgi:hypothetical protein
MAKVMYEKNGEIKSLVQWVKKMKQFDLQLTFADLTKKQTSTIAFTEDEARHNGFFMNFGKGKATDVSVLGSQDITLAKFNRVGYVPANFGLVETQEEEKIEKVVESVEGN